MWLSGYNYRVPITITNSSGGTLTNYQVHVTINTANLISLGKLQSNGNDLTATDTDGSTQLSSWFDPTTLNTATTDLWIKIPSLPAGTYTIYVYYGNSGASMQSSIVNTFIYGDDFSSNTVANYTTSGTVSIDTANKIMSIVAPAYPGNGIATPTTQTDPASYIVEAYASVAGEVIAGDDELAGLLGFKSTATGTDGYVAQHGLLNAGGAHRAVDIEKFGIAHLANTTITSSDNVFYPLKGTFVSGSITALFNNITSVNAADSSYTSGMYGMRTFNTTGKYKYFRVRAYTATEPTTSNGNEQSTRLPQIIMINQSIVRASRW